MTGMETVATIRCDEMGSFPWSVLHDRHPALMAKVRAAHPYPAGVDAALADLIDETLHRPMTPLPASAPDAADWLAWDGGRHFGRSWFDAPFLFAESYFYRRILQATGYFGDGDWRGVDPFGPEKRTELAMPSIDDELAALAANPDAVALTAAATWGNRADLVFLMADPTSLASGEAGRLLIDDSAVLWESIAQSAPVRLGYVADNAGLEMLHDLVLIDHVLAHGLASTVTLYVKPRPYFVSDTTRADLDDCLARLSAEPRVGAAIADRLAGARATSRLVVRADELFCAPVPYSEVALAPAFDGIDLTIFKGDLNYRRLIGDRHWLGTESFAELTAYFPTPLAALRTVKSEVIVGMDAGVLAALDTAEPRWRFSGSHAVVQARLR